MTDKQELLDQITKLKKRNAELERVVNDSLHLLTTDHCDPSETIDDTVDILKAVL